MPNKHFPLLIILAGLGFIIAGMVIYPGGSQANPHSTGYSLQHNYLCNLFDPVAMNGADSQSPRFAIPGMAILCTGIFLLFFRFGKAQSSSLLTGLIIYPAVITMLAAILVVTPLHDIMITIAAGAALLTLVATGMILYKTGKQFLFRLGVLSFILLTATYYVYHFKFHLEWLPLLQKISFLVTVGWLLLIDYFVSTDNKLH